MLGEAEKDEQGNVIMQDGRPKVALCQAGRTTIGALRNYVRKGCGIDLLLKDEQGEEQEDDGWEESATAP